MKRRIPLAKTIGLLPKSFNLKYKYMQSPFYANGVKLWPYQYRALETMNGQVLQMLVAPRRGPFKIEYAI